MGSKPVPSSVRRLRRRSSKAHLRLAKPRRIADDESVSDRLEALRNLIPSNNEEIKPDQLFQETADYIVLLETQVLVLQKLIDFYGSEETRDAV